MQASYTPDHTSRENIIWISNNTNMIAHRGYSSIAPENTLSAFNLAVQKGFWGIECDIWETADGEFAISHNNSLQKATGVDVNITELTMDEIQSHPIINGNQVDIYTDERIPSLNQYLEILSNSEDTMAIIELKKMDFSSQSLERMLELVNTYQVNNRVIYISFHRHNLSFLRRMDDACDLQYLIKEMTDDDIDYCLEYSIDISFQVGGASVKQIETLKKAGRKVSVWTVNDVSTARKYLSEYKVDYLTTDFFLT